MKLAVAHRQALPSQAQRKDVCSFARNCWLRKHLRSVENAAYSSIIGMYSSITWNFALVDAGGEVDEVFGLRGNATGAGRVAGCCMLVAKLPANMLMT